MSNDDSSLRFMLREGKRRSVDALLDRLTALEAEHAKDRARIERLERLLAYALDEVRSMALETMPEWARTLWDAMHDELVEIDRARGCGE